MEGLHRRHRPGTASLHTRTRLLNIRRLKQALHLSTLHRQQTHMRLPHLLPGILTVTLIEIRIAIPTKIRTENAIGTLTGIHTGTHIGIRMLHHLVPRHPVLPHPVPTRQHTLMAPHQQHTRHQSMQHHPLLATVLHRPATVNIPHHRAPRPQRLILRQDMLHHHRCTIPHQRLMEPRLRDTILRHPTTHTPHSRATGHCRDGADPPADFVLRNDYAGC
mmetsp:Transcript_119792/g.284617  ORF Transcript_119792/g.284617 Transcript_119792/m.284617 type:complete len:219 (+) Transcript_119792:166-822(+)